MNRLLLLSSMAVCLVILMSTKQAIAQEDQSTSVHITIKEDGKVTTDTTFELKEGQNPNMVKKMVQQMVGNDDCEHKELGDDEEHEMHFKHEGHGDHEVMIIESDEDGKKVTVEIEDESEEDVEKEVEVKVEVKAEWKK